MTAYGKNPAPHSCRNPMGPASRAGQVWRCWCGQAWHSTTVNDIWTGGPLIIWARVGWWNFRARHHLARQSRSTG